MNQKLHSVMSFVSALNCTQERDQVLKVIIATAPKQRNSLEVTIRYRTCSLMIKTCW